MIYEHLRAIRHKARVGVACVYCDNQQQHVQTPEALLASLWSPLYIDHEKPLPSYIDNLYRVHSLNRTRPDLQEVQNVIHSAITNLDKAYILIDGLDELSDIHQKSFMESIQTLLTASNTINKKLQVLVTSRFDQLLLEGTSTRIHATKEEIEAMVEHRITSKLFRSSLSEKVMQDSNLRNKIRDNIAAKANGIFLIANLQVDMLGSMTNTRALEQALDTLPEKLDDFYIRIWTRVQKQEKHLNHLAYQTLSWLFLAQRQLKVDELQHALATQVDDTDFSANGLTDIADIVAICQGLVIVEENSRCVRLLHSTLLDFLEERRDTLFKQSASYLTDICLTYLSFDLFKEATCRYSTPESADAHAQPGEKIRRRSIFSYRVNGYTLYKYAAENWGYHARGNAERSCLSRIMEFLLCSHALNHANTISPQVFYPTKRFHLPESFENLHGVRVAISFGLEWIACQLAYGVTMMIPSRIKRHGHDSKVITQKHMLLALLEAVENGQTKVVRRLLDLGYAPSLTIELPQTVCDQTFFYSNERPQTMLDKSVFHGHSEVTKLLLDRNVGCGITCQTMEFAVGVENFDILTRLISASAHETGLVDPANEILHFAAKKGRVDVIKFILNHGASLSDEYKFLGHTALVTAVIHGQSEVVQYLLDRKADVSIMSRDFSVEERERFCSLVQVAIQSQEVFNTRINFVREFSTAFTSADIHDRATERLAARLKAWLTADPDPYTLLDNPEFLAAIRDDSEGGKIVKMLLNAGVDILEQGENGESLLHLAVISKPRTNAVLEHLRHNPQTTLTVNARDHKGRTPLHYAAVTCNPGVMETLIDHDADVFATDSSGVTTLHFAVHSSRCAAIALRQGCRVDIAHEDLGNPLQFAKSLDEVSPRVVQVLEWSFEEVVGSGAHQAYNFLPAIDSGVYHDTIDWMVSLRDRHWVLCAGRIELCLLQSLQERYNSNMTQRKAEAAVAKRTWELVPDH